MLKLIISLNFNTHMDEICKKVCADVYLCLFVWMCHSRIRNSKINRLHERYLRLIHNDKRSSFHEPLERDSSVSIHKRNLCFTGIEMFKIMKGKAPTVVREMFTLNKKRDTNFAIELCFYSVHNGKV